MALHFFQHVPAACIEASGEDASRFLQSQFSNDLETTAARACVYGLWLDRKGRVAADSFVLGRAGGAYLLLSPTSPGGVILQKLEAFIIADDVALEERAGALHCTSIWGAGAGACLLRMGFELPANGEYAERDGMLLHRGRTSRADSFDIVHPPGEAATLRRALEDAGGQAAAPQEAEAERIRSRIPAIPRDCGSEAIPQELGIAPDSVSFTKGCFIGQEVMARVRQTGRYTRQLVPVELKSDPGTLPLPVFAIDDPAPAGELTTAAPGDGRWIGLALMRRKALEQHSGFTAGGADVRVDFEKSEF